MVAFATDHEPGTPTVEPKNRVGDFFVDIPGCIGIDGPQTRTVAGENDRFSYDACRSISLAQGGDTWKGRPRTNDKTRLAHAWEGLKQTVDLKDAISSARQIKPTSVSRTNPTRIARPLVVSVSNFGMGLAKIAEAVFGKQQYSRLPTSGSEMWDGIDKDVQLRLQEQFLGSELNQMLEEGPLNYDNRKKLHDEILKILDDDG